NLCPTLAALWRPCRICRPLRPGGDNLKLHPSPNFIRGGALQNPERRARRRWFISSQGWSAPVVAEPVRIGLNARSAPLKSSKASAAASISRAVVARLGSGLQTLGAAWVRDLWICAPVADGHAMGQF